MTSTRNGKLTQTLESTTPAIRNAGVTVELGPGGVSGGREIGKKIKLLGCVVALCTVECHTPYNSYNPLSGKDANFCTLIYSTLDHEIPTIFLCGIKFER